MKRTLPQLLCIAVALIMFGCSEPSTQNTGMAHDAPPPAASPEATAQPDTDSAEGYVAHHNGEAESTEETTVGSATAAASVEPKADYSARSPRPLAFNPATDIDGVPRVSVDDVQRLARTEAVHLLDVRSVGAFASEHAIYSINIPEQEVFQRFAELPRDGIIVAICT